MPYFSSKRNVSMFNFYNKQLLSMLVEQKIVYYSIDRSKTTADELYGETDDSVAPFFDEPIIIDCTVKATDQNNTERGSIPNMTREIDVYFWKPFLIDHNIVPRKGDFICWNEDYYEISATIENQYFLGKVPEFSYTNSTDDEGGSLSILVTARYVSKDKLGID